MSVKVKYRTILVTGANGLLGSGILRRICLSKYTLVGINHSPINLRIGGVEYRNLDFASDWVTDSLPPKVDVIVHLAQSHSFRDFPNSALDVFKVNIESTACLLDYARQAGVKKFIYASSGGVYGNGAQAFKENSPIVPPGQLGYYLGSKACGEILVQSYASVFDVVVVRPFFIYGPGQNRSMLIPRLFDSVATGKPISLQGDNGIRINPIHVNDAASAVATAIDLNESATFNIGGPEVLSIRDICEGMGRYLGVEPIFEQQAGEPNDLIADISAMKQKLVVPRYSLLDSLDDVAWSSER